MTRTAACATSILFGLIAAEPVVHLVQHAALNRFYTISESLLTGKIPSIPVKGRISNGQYSRWPDVLDLRVCLSPNALLPRVAGLLSDPLP